MKASTRSMTPTMEAHCSATASSKSRSICAAAPPTSPSTASGVTTTSSNATKANRRTRSMPRPGPRSPRACRHRRGTGWARRRPGRPRRRSRPRPPPRPLPSCPRARSSPPCRAASRVIATGEARSRPSRRGTRWRWTRRERRPGRYAPSVRRCPNSDSAAATTLVGRSGPGRHPAAPSPRPPGSGPAGRGRTRCRHRPPRSTSSEVQPSSAPWRHQAPG